MWERVQIELGSKSRDKLLMKMEASHNLSMHNRKVEINKGIFFPGKEVETERNTWRRCRMASQQAVMKG